MLRRWMLGGAGGLLLASVLWARPGAVLTKNGQTFMGEVNEQGDQVAVDQKGIHTTIARDDVRSITYSDSIEQDYHRRLAKLTRYDVPGRVKLAQWLFENKAYDLARSVLDEAARIQPHNPDVAAMILTVDRQAELDAREARKHAPAQLAAADDNLQTDQSPQHNPAPARADRLLTPEEINFVRQNEWQGGQQVRARFVDDVRRKYIAREGINPAEFNRLTPGQQAWEILQNGTPEMKKDVILGDPPVMIQFRKVQQSLLATCANCHNPGKPSGGFALHIPAHNDADTYTNFVILQKYSHKEGDRSYHMIDRERPRESLLIQFALPPDMGDPPHPRSGKYQGAVRSANDLRLKMASAWISSLNPVTPDYSGIDLSPANPTTMPSTPSTAPAAQ